ncbi:MAG: MFS transporter [Chloroflexota bacterium]
MYAYIQLLRRNPAYARLWAAQAVSLLGDWFDTIALLALVARFSNGSGVAVSALLVARFLPPLIVGPFAGVLVDRLNRKLLMIISDSARVLIVLGFLLVSDASHLWIIYLLTALQFSFSAMFDPARNAILPSLVIPDDLVKANFLGSATWSVMLAAGAAIGGAVAGLFGTSTALVVDAASFALSALLIASIHIGQNAAASTAADKPAVAEPKSQMGFVDGLRYIAKRPATAATLLIKLGGSIGSLDTFMALYATQRFVIGENGTGSLGIMYAAFGLGAVLGPIILNRFNADSIRIMRRYISIGYVCITLGWFFFGGAPTLFIAALGLLVKAMGSSVYWTYSSVILQKTVPDKFLGRLFALDSAGFQLASVVSIIITGWLLDRLKDIPVQNFVIGTGIVSLIPLIVWTLALPWIERKALIERELKST